MSILVIESKAAGEFFDALVHDAGMSETVIIESVDRALCRLGVDGVPGETLGINVVVVDGSRPGASGLDACRRIRGDDALEDLPVLVLTAGAEVRHFEEALSAGATDCISLPLRRPEALARIQTALALKRELERRKAAERELVETTRSLERLSVVDELTGALNRRSFDRAFDREYRRAVRDSLPLTVGMISVDEFERYRTKHGNIEADECLTEIVEALASAVRRAGDVIARYGGDKFAFVLPDTPGDGAASVGEALRRTVDSLVIEASPGRRLTLSVGMATAKIAREVEMAALLCAADEALDEALERGGNSCVARTLERAS